VVGAGRVVDKFEKLLGLREILSLKHKQSVSKHEREERRRERA
jgi:hypothetical protein